MGAWVKLLHRKRLESFHESVVTQNEGGYKFFESQYENRANLAAKRTGVYL